MIDDRGRHPGSQGREPSAHELRVRFLDTMAVLAGCNESLGAQLPDGRRPDVMRVDASRGLLFIGDAKDTESSGCTATRARLREYLVWMLAHVSAGSRPGVFALCIGYVSDTKGWVRTVQKLSYEVGLDCSEWNVREFGTGVVMVWFLPIPLDRQGATDQDARDGLSPPTTGPSLAGMPKR